MSVGNCDAIEFSSLSLSLSLYLYPPSILPREAATCTASREHCARARRRGRRGPEGGRQRSCQKTTMETSNSRRCFQRRQPASRASTPAPRPPPWRRREEVEPDTVLVLLLLHLSSAHSLWRPQKGTKAGGLIAIAVEVEERRIRRRRRQCPLRWASLRGPIASPSRLSRTDRRLEALDGDAEGQAQGRKVGCLLFSMASFLLQSPLFPLESERGRK